MRCGGAHARIDCPKSTDARATDDLPDPCIKWNYSSCTWDDKCFRRHECFHCLGPHRIVDCPQRPVLNESLMRSVREAAEGAAAEPCANYNHGRCRLADKCKRAHVCSECGHKGHTVDACTKNRNHDRHFVDLPTIVQDAGAASTAKSIADASDTTGQTYDVYSYHDVCLNWNNSRCRLPSSQCRRVHVCSLCNSPSHAAMECPMPGLAPRDLVEAGVEICLNFNNGRCSGVTERGVGIECKRVHVCTVCKRSGHPAIKCDWDEKKAAAAAAATSAEVASAAAAKRAGATSPTSEICRNWNEGKCRLGSERCKRVHACSSCGSRGHTAPDCTATAAQPTPKDSSATSSTAVVGNGSSDICMNWNLGRCRLGKRCRRPHLCWSCGRGDHVHKDCRRST